jgi:hypothetical protein
MVMSQLENRYGTVKFAVVMLQAWVHCFLNLGRPAKSGDRLVIRHPPRYGTYARWAAFIVTQGCDIDHW